MPANLPHSPNSPNGVTVKPRLTKAQKNANHIASERKRRRVIRKGFDKLASIVPGMEGYARAEGIVLHGSASYIRQLMLARRSMIEALEKKGMHVPGHYKL
ncbi:protein max [Chaetomidium leptoderma]|uniref:Protein max n=1 Tax=Chaetomidium leptoderma TaxID=669021 RepID=A0AAN6VV15_9PEZI|nr:protein max [Chaetomidium leptoderma]